MALCILACLTFGIEQVGTGACVVVLDRYLPLIPMPVPTQSTSVPLTALQGSQGFEPLTACFENRETVRTSTSNLCLSVDPMDLPCGGDDDVLVVDVAG